jgi:hypothetical protein
MDPWNGRNEISNLGDLGVLSEVFPSARDRTAGSHKILTSWLLNPLPLDFFLRGMQSDKLPMAACPDRQWQCRKRQYREGGNSECQWVSHHGWIDGPKHNGGATDSYPHRKGKQLRPSGQLIRSATPIENPNRQHHDQYRKNGGSHCQ